VPWTRGPQQQSRLPKLAGQNADYLTRQLANFKTGVRTSDPMQQEVAHLTAAKMRGHGAVFKREGDTSGAVAHAGRRRSAWRSIYSGDPENGVTACITCHGPEGRGAMYLPRLAGQHAKYLVAQLHAFRDQSRVAPDMVMHTVIENVSDAGIVAVAQFLSGMK